jgi:hypothetical protein
MLLIEHENTCVVMVEGADGQRQPHGPFGTEDEACTYLQTMFNTQPATLEKWLGFKVMGASVTRLVEFSGMLHSSDMVMSKKRLHGAVAKSFTNNYEGAK